VGSHVAIRILHLGRPLYPTSAWFSITLNDDITESDNLIRWVVLARPSLLVDKIRDNEFLAIFALYHLLAHLLGLNNGLREVVANAISSSTFYSPWFGMDPADNLNLIQPVNPWLGSNWNMYTEYYEWDNGYNSNSDNYNVNAGQTLHGVLTYLPATDSYNLSQTNVETQQMSQQMVQCENGKKFVIPYFVYEKTWPCQYYPPDQIVTFRDIIIECDGKPCTSRIQWSAQVKDSNCNMAAHIINSTTITITWSTSAESKYALYSMEELTMLNHKTSQGWSSN